MYLLAAILIFLAGIMPLHAAEFGVSPMLIEMSAAPDVSQKFEINVIGKTGGNARVSLFGLQQQPTGHMAFIEPDSSELSVNRWVTLDQKRFSLRKGETRTISGSVKVPRKSAGNLLAAVMIEEDAPAKRAGVQVNVRYAVILNLSVDGLGRARTLTRMGEVSLESQSDRVFVKGLFRNSGRTDGVLESELVLRDAGNRLVFRTPLKTQSAWQRSDNGSRVFPGSEVVVFGELPRHLPAGNYQALVRNRFGDRAQPMTRIELELPATLFDSGASGAPVTVDAAASTRSSDSTTAETL